MSWEEYYSQPREAPYVFELHMKTGELLYYGVFHTVNPEDYQLKEIEAIWDVFQPTVALCEGGIWPLEYSRLEAVQRYGEQGLLRYLADRDHVAVKSIEPGMIREAFHLLDKYSPTRIKIFYILRKAAVNQMLKRDPGDTRYVFNILAKLSRLKGFENAYPGTMTEFKECIRLYFPGLKDWRKVPTGWFVSCRTGRWTNQMSAAVNDFRNKIMIKTLLKEIKKGERVFALVGRSHVVMQEPVLRSAAEETVDP
jgi:hypothetical protein